MADYLRIVGWEKFQHYHRKHPTWIKLYACIFDAYQDDGSPAKMPRLSDRAFRLCVGLWCLRTKYDRIPNDPAWLDIQLGIKTRDALRELVDTRLVEVENDNGTLPLEVPLDHPLEDPLPQSSENREQSSEIRVQRADGLSAASDFDRFWAVYPRKVKKPKAREAWNKAKPPIGAVLAALAWQIPSAHWREEGGRFIPHPTSYINAGRWEDERPDESTIHESPEPKSAKAFRDLRRKYGKPEIVEAEAIE